MKLIVLALLGILARAQTAGAYGTPLLTMPNGSTLYAFYDTTNLVVQYDVIVMNNTYLAIGYGTSMTDTDMIYWGANGASSVQQNLWATGHSTPVEQTNAYTTTFEVLDNDNVHFTSTRPLDPGLGANYYVI